MNAMDIWIDKVEAVLLNIPRRGLSPVHNLLIRIHTNIGVTGIGATPIIATFGETGPEALLMVKEHYTPILLKQNPLHIEALMSKLDHFFYVAHLPSQGAVDIALHDIKGKVLGVPVYQLLGGLVREKIPLLAPQIQRANPQEQAREAATWVEKGFKAVKVKVGGGGVEDDVRRVKEVRNAIGSSMEMRVDANEYYDPISAVSLINKLEPFDPIWVEDPVPSMRHSWDIDGLARVHRMVKVPIMGGQLGTTTDLLKIIRAEAVDCIKMKVTRGGGMMKSKQTIALAQAANMPLVTGNGSDNDISFAAEVAVNASSPYLTRACESTGAWSAYSEEFRLVKEPIVVENGSAQVSEKSGLGVELIDIDDLNELAERLRV
jgi:L-alanine-DL-glutamate epimerase-like enolase superfamily enzyme